MDILPPVAPFNNSKYGLTLITPWISNHMHSKVCGEVTYPFPNVAVPLNFGDG